MRALRAVRALRSWSTLRSVRALRSWSTLRYAGLVAAGSLSAGSYLAGALPSGDPGAGLFDRGFAAMPATFLIGLAGSALGGAGLIVVWWRLGRRIQAAELPGPGPRWLLVTGLLWALPLLVAVPLGSRDVYSYACQGWLYANGFDPYVAGPAAGPCPWLGSVAPLWRDTPAPYGPLILAVSAALAGLATADPGGWLATGGVPAAGVVGSGFRIPALVGVVLVAGGSVRLARIFGRRPAQVLWLGTITPMVAVHAVAGAHHDALLAGLVVAALALAARSGPAAPGARSGPAAPGARSGPAAPGARSGSAAPAVTGTAGERRGLIRAVAAGTVLGLALAVKITAVVGLPFVAILAAAPAQRYGARWLGRAGAAIAATGVCFCAVTLGSGLGFGWLAAFRDTAQFTQWTSLPSGVGMAAGYLLRGLGRPEAFDQAVAVARAAGLVTLAATGLILVRLALRRSAEPSAVVASCGAAFVAVLLLTPVCYPWYALTPLAILAASTSGERYLRWLTGATAVLTALVLPNGLGVAVLTKLPGAVAVTVLAAVGLARGVRVVRTAARGERDRERDRDLDRDLDRERDRDLDRDRAS